MGGPSIGSFPNSLIWINEETIIWLFLIALVNLLKVFRQYESAEVSVREYNIAKGVRGYVSRIADAASGW